MVNGRVWWFFMAWFLVRREEASHGRDFLWGAAKSFLHAWQNQLLAGSENRPTAKPIGKAGKASLITYLKEEKNAGIFFLSHLREVVRGPPCPFLAGLLGPFLVGQQGPCRHVGGDHPSAASRHAVETMRPRPGASNAILVQELPCKLGLRSHGNMVTWHHVQIDLSRNCNRV